VVKRLDLEHLGVAGCPPHQIIPTVGKLLVQEIQMSILATDEWMANW
jgi:hypothetical protein